jgi:multicomponent Na+:H+ antiporter subunit A
LLSIGAIATGGLLATQERRLAAHRIIASISGAQLFDRLIEAILAFATGMTRQIQSGRLRTYILYTLLAFLVLIGAPFLSFGLSEVRVPYDTDLRFYEVVAIGLIPVGIIATIGARSRLGAIIAVSMVGAMVSLLFVLFSAADLALTQLLIEVLSTVYLLFLFSVLPARFRNFSPAWVRWRDAGIALAFGLLMTGLVLATATSTMFPPIAPYFLENSISGGKGANVVNVILVDFRGLDTLGEITVLFVALLGIFGLLRFRKQRSESRSSGRALQTILPGEAGMSAGNGANGGHTDLDDVATVTNGAREKT